MMRSSSSGDILFLFYPDFFLGPVQLRAWEHMSFASVYICFFCPSSESSGHLHIGASKTARLGLSFWCMNTWDDVAMTGRVFSCIYDPCTVGQMTGTGFTLKHVTSKKSAVPNDLTGTLGSSNVVSVSWYAPLPKRTSEYGYGFGLVF